jgi:perosamine synthetase
MKRVGVKERQLVEEVLSSGFRNTHNHQFVDQLEKLFCQKNTNQFAVAMCNGTATLHTSLAALGIGAGDEVIVPPLTMASTALSVIQAGAVPVFSDVDPETFNLCPHAVAENITEKTKAIITVALYGLPPDYNGFLELCHKHNLALIEDNAQALFAEYKGKLVGKFGQFASYSFQASKHLSAGEGGMLVTDDPDLAEKARRFACLGYATVSVDSGKIDPERVQSPEFSRHQGFGFNYRMPDLCAAVLNGQLEHANELIQVRIDCALQLKEVLVDSGLFQLQKIPDDCTHTYWSLAAVLNHDIDTEQWYNFKKLFRKNNGEGFYAAWKLTYKEPYFLDQYQKSDAVWQNYNRDLCPVAESLQPRILQFKTNHWNSTATQKQVDALMRTVQEFSGS